MVQLSQMHYLQTEKYYSSQLISIMGGDKTQFYVDSTHIMVTKMIIYNCFIDF